MYLSQVKIVLTKKHVRRIKEELNKVKSNLWDVKNNIKEFIGIDDKKYVEIEWNNTEWYLGYIDVFTIYKTLSEFKAKGIPFGMIKVGENPQDVEQYCYNDENYIVSSRIILNKIEKSLQRV